MKSPTMHSDPQPRTAWILATWVALLVVTHAAGWAAGGRSTGLARAIEVGEAKVEAKVSGADLGPDAARNLIQIQHDTRTFWATLALLGDFAVDPLALVARPLLVATLFAAWAALAGRPSGFAVALRESALLQGLWVAGPALAVGLDLVAPPGPADTTLALFLPPGTHPAWLWAALRQVDPFALWGWLALAVGAARRRQVPIALGLATVAPLLAAEVVARGVGAAVLGAGMRLSIIPG